MKALLDELGNLAVTYGTSNLERAVKTFFKVKRKPLTAGHQVRLLANWSWAVRERDEHTCRRCGKYDLDNHAHHIAPRGRRPDLRLDLKNGATLCDACHGWVHDHPAEATELGLLSTASYEKR